MADRYWVLGGSGFWNTSDTSNWSATPGGASGASAPTTADNVIFDRVGTYSVTVTSTSQCANWTASAGTITFATGTTPTLTITGSLNWTGATVSASFAFGVTFSGSGSKTINTNGQTLGGNPINLSTSGATYTLGGNFVTTANINVNAGVTFSTSASNYSFTSSGYIFIGIGTTVNLNASTLTMSGTTIIGGTGQTNATLNASSSTINCSGSTVTFTSLNYPAFTFGTVAFTNATGSAVTINQANTFSTLSFAGRTALGVNSVNFSANQTIGTLTLNAGTAAAYRTVLRSDTIGTPRTLAVTTLTAGAADYDFRDIAVTGAAAPLSGTRFGDCKGNSGITFPAAKTVYFRSTTGNWGTTGTGSWSLTNNGAADATAFPLAQDTAVFPASPTAYPTSGQTVTISLNYNIGTIDMSARTATGPTATMTLATGAQTPAIYGNWINGTGTTLTGTGLLTFAGRGGQTITSATKTWPHLFAFNTPGGSVTLLDNFSASQSQAALLTVTAGTLNAGGYNVNLTGVTSGVTSSGTGTRTIAIGSGTWTVKSWVISGSNITVTGTGTISLARNTTFDGGNVQTYPTLDIAATGLTITGSNGFNKLTNNGTGSPTRLTLTTATSNRISEINSTGATALEIVDTLLTGANIKNTTRIVGGDVYVTGPLTLGTS